MRYLPMMVVIGVVCASALGQTTKPAANEYPVLQKQLAALRAENEQLKDEIAKLKNQIAALSAPKAEAKSPPTSDTPPATVAQAKPLGVANFNTARVIVTAVAVEKPELKTFTGTTRGDDPELVIRLRIENKSDTKKLDYITLRGQEMDFQPSLATLIDEHGNRYKRIGYGMGANPVGAVERSESIYPGKSVEDVLIFEPPVGPAKKLKLEIPAKNVGDTGESITLEIATDLIKK